MDRFKNRWRNRLKSLPSRWTKLAFIALAAAGVGVVVIRQTWRAAATSLPSLVGTAWEQSGRLGMFTIHKDSVITHTREDRYREEPMKRYKRFVFAPSGAILISDDFHVWGGHDRWCDISGLPAMHFPDKNWSSFKLEEGKLIVATRDGKTIVFRPFEAKRAEAYEFGLCSSLHPDTGHMGINIRDQPEEYDPDRKCTQCGAFCCVVSTQRSNGQPRRVGDSDYKWSFAQPLGILKVPICPSSVVIDQPCGLHDATCYLPCKPDTDEQDDCLPADPKFLPIFGWDDRYDPLNYPARDLYKGRDYRRYVMCKPRTVLL